MIDWLLLLLPIAVIIDATAQGKLTLLTREYVPSTVQKQVNLPLHYLYPCLYILLAGAIYIATLNVTVIAIALMTRVALFDPVLNWAKSDPVFAVGFSATIDKLIRRIANHSHVRPEIVSATGRVTAIMVIILILVSKF